jgi:hypothetical protein
VKRIAGNAVVLHRVLFKFGFAHNVDIWRIRASNIPPKGETAKKSGFPRQMLLIMAQ